MNKNQHEELANGRWFTLSLAEQLGNIGSEVGRAINWKNKNNTEYYEKAFVRILELLDLTLADKRWTGCRKKEIARVREALCDSFEGNSQSFQIPLSDWPQYFMHFAVYARKKTATRV